MIGSKYNGFFQNLANNIYEAGHFQAFLDMSPNDGDAWLRESPKLSAQYEQFLDIFGHRCLREV